MNEFGGILLDVWREVCRHIDIEEAAGLIAPILSPCFPAAVVLVRRVDFGRSCVETVAAGICGDGSPPLETRTECKAGELEAWLAWARRNEILRGSSKLVRRTVPGLTPDGIFGDLVAGPLSAGGGPTGALLLLSSRGASFEQHHEAMLRALLEPFSVALENDRRLHELNALREAAEADRRSLLNRLGRQDLSDTIVGADGGLRHVLERVGLVARSDAPVLIFGETGSGKEVVARAIHSRSPRAARPFHRVNCGAMPADLIDSELFGHERGSFTGAVAMRKGWFERADGGTLFLDEIGELPLAAQVRLLRILQDGTFERVGGQKQLAVDVRIVGATHRNLQVMVADGRFREDLWYRLAVFPIHLPALREHPEDIPDLAAHFAMKAARRFGTPPMMPTADDLDMLVGYSWPGNVRELQSVMERAVILGNGGRLDVSKALGAATAPASSSIARSIAPRVEASPGTDEIVSLDTAMRRHIETALAKTNGRVEGPHGAARLLKINPHTLRARMRKLRIAWKQFRTATP